MICPFAFLALSAQLQKVPPKAELIALPALVRDSSQPIAVAFISQPGAIQTLGTRSMVQSKLGSVAQWPQDKGGQLMRLLNSEGHLPVGTVVTEAVLSKTNPKLPLFHSDTKLHDLRNEEMMVSRDLQGDLLSANNLIYLDPIEDQETEVEEGGLALSFAGRARPARTYYWLAGDGHVHTNHSDGVFSLAFRILQARQNGYRWLGITDHIQQMSSTDFDKRWKDYCAAVAAASPIKLLRGLEYSTVSPNADDPDDDAHLIALGFGDTPYPNPPKGKIPKTDTGEAIVGSLLKMEATITLAHPLSTPLFKKYPWFHGKPYAGWDNLAAWYPTLTQRPMGFEIMSTFETQPEKGTVDRWDELLSQGLKVFPTAGSDCHAPDWIGRCFTYVRCASRDGDDLMSGIQGGHTVATAGPFAWIEVNGKGPGEEATIGGKAPTSVKLMYRGKGQPTSGRLVFGDYAASAVTHRVPIVWKQQGKEWLGKCDWPAHAPARGYVRLEAFCSAELVWQLFRKDLGAYSAPIYLR